MEEKKIKTIKPKTLKLSGVVRENELLLLGCEKRDKGFADLHIYECERHAYLCQDLGNQEYMIIMGYVRDNPKENWC